MKQTLVRLRRLGGATLIRAALGYAALVAITFATPAQALPQCGGASWYAMTSKTASGERANPSTMTAAHRTLPFGTKVRVTNLRNGRSVIVRINDRGPFVRGRVIDVSKAAAARLGFVAQGTTQVRVNALGYVNSAAQRCS